jgi:hypothetical protein
LKTSIIVDVGPGPSLRSLLLANNESKFPVPKPSKIDESDCPTREEAPHPREAGP